VAKAPKKYSLDIFRTLAAIDRHDLTYFDNLSDDEKKGYHSPVVMQWASAKSGAMADYALMAVNERSNMYHYALYEHTALQYKLLASVGLGRTSKSDWIAGAKKEKSGASEFILRYYPEANPLEVSIILKHLLEGDNLKAFLDGTGLAPDEVKRVQKLFAA
jgi:hypothetical protein